MISDDPARERRVVFLNSNHAVMNRHPMTGKKVLGVSRNMTLLPTLSRQQSSMTRSLTTLLTDLIDYAGLFPPAKLDMARSVEEYNRARMGESEFALGRFVCPVSRLAEFSGAASSLLPGTFARSGYREQADAGGPWRLSVLFDGDLGADLDAIDAFNRHHSTEEHGLALIDAAELKVVVPNGIDAALDEIPEDLYPFFEFPVNADCRGFVAALAGSAAGAKIRTGGITAAAFPTPAEVARFLVACAQADVPFKATAGLHHPVRGPARLTYEHGAPSHTMHGFLNVFIGAALVKVKGLDVERAEALLADESPQSFKFGDDFLSWCGHGLDVGQVAAVREKFALSFGSCSFSEPMNDLAQLGLI